MNKISFLYNFVSRYKYLITIVVGLVVVGFVGSNSLYQRFVLQWEIADLKSEVEQYNKVYKADSKQLHDLERDPRNIERIARERYFMKADDEDIYILTTDPVTTGEEMPTPEKKKNETAD